MKEDIAEALRAHGAWKMRFRDFLAGRIGLEIATVGDSGACAFGQWLRGDGGRLLPADDFARIDEAHAEFHRVAAEVIRKVKAQEIAGARSDLAPDGAFSVASEALHDLMLRASLHSPRVAAPVPVAAAAPDEPAEGVPPPA
jgi:hypothetical protein